MRLSSFTRNVNGCKALSRLGNNRCERPRLVVHYAGPRLSFPNAVIQLDLYGCFPTPFEAESAKLCYFFCQNVRL